jgi:hypothetical protein
MVKLERPGLEYFRGDDESTLFFWSAHKEGFTRVRLSN